MCSSMLFASFHANFLFHSRLISPHSLGVRSLLGWSEFGQGASTADMLVADQGWELSVAFLVGNKCVRVQSLLVNSDTMI